MYSLSHCHNAMQVASRPRESQKGEGRGRASYPEAFSSLPHHTGWLPCAIPQTNCTGISVLPHSSKFCLKRQNPDTVSYSRRVTTARIRQAAMLVTYIGQHGQPKAEIARDESNRIKERRRRDDSGHKLHINFVDVMPIICIFKAFGIPNLCSLTIQ